MNIEFEGLLYRGSDLRSPTEVWNYPEKCWVAYRGGPWLTERSGIQIDDARAEALKANNRDAEHFMYYDDPPWRQPMGESYSEAMTTDAIKQRIAVRQRQLGRKPPG